MSTVTTASRAAITRRRSRMEAPSRWPRSTNEIMFCEQPAAAARSDWRHPRRRRRARTMRPTRWSSIAPCSPARLIGRFTATMSAMPKVQMPQLGESVAEGTIGKWLKKVGDHVDKYEPIVEVITDKVNAEVPSPFEGTLTQILVQEGETVPTNTEIAATEGAGAEAA